MPISRTSVEHLHVPVSGAGSSGIRAAGVLISESLQLTWFATHGFPRAVTVLA